MAGIKITPLLIIKTVVLLLVALWLEIPFPQRDLNMRNPLHVVLSNDVAD